MKVVDATNADCKKTLPLLDAYLSNELTTESAALINRHLEKCTGCRRKLDVRARVKLGLQLSIARTKVPKGLSRRVFRRVRRAVRFGWRDFFPDLE